MWLAPVQVKLLPISDNQIGYSMKIKNELEKLGIRIELDDRNEKIGYKIREAQMQKVPYMLVIGEKEVENNNVSIRSRKDGDIGQMSVEEFKDKIKTEIENFEK